MSTENPLKVIGIAPEALQHTTLDQAKRLVETLGKERLRVEHPDMGGDPQRFQALHEAIRSLKDGNALQRAIKELRQPQRTKAAKLEQALQDAQLETKAATDRADAFMLAGAGGFPELTIYDGLELRLRDILRAKHVHTMHGPSINQLFVTLSVKDGQIIESQRAGKRKGRQSRMFGCLHQNDVPADFNQALDFILACRPTAAHQALPGAAGLGASSQSTGNFFSWNRSAPFRSLLRPELRQNAIVFSFRDGDEPGLLVEGQLLEAKAADHD